MRHKNNPVLNFVLALAILASLIVPQSSVHAAATLTIEPITWNIIGLDSNNVNVGPSNFPSGARVCNTGDAAANVAASFVFDDAADLYTGSQILVELAKAAEEKGCGDLYLHL